MHIVAQCATTMRTQSFWYLLRCHTAPSQWCDESTGHACLLQIQPNATRAKVWTHAFCVRVLGLSCRKLNLWLVSQVWLWCGRAGDDICHMQQCKMPLPCRRMPIESTSTDGHQQGACMRCIPSQDCLSVCLVLLLLTVELNKLSWNR